MVAEDGRRVDIDDVSEVRRGRSVAVGWTPGSATRPCAWRRASTWLLCEATYLESEVSLARDYGHLTARQAATVAREADVGLLVLTHFSDRYPDLDGHRREAGEVFPEVVVAEDLQVVGMGASRGSAGGAPGRRAVP